jgi:glycosyltransferase involved in cell wall biosynthesis
MPVADRRYRVLAICAHPVQYMAPILRLLAAHPGLDFQVAYCSLQGAEAFHDPEFNTTVKWDVPLLDGYAWQEVPNRGSQGTESGSFFGLYNPGLWKIIREGNFDAVLCFTGYVCATFWIAYLASNLSRSAFLFGADAWTLASMIDPKSWKVLFKRVFWPRLYSLASKVIVPSSASRDLMITLKIPPERITLTPYSVDNEWWKRQSGLVDRNAVRSRWQAGAESSVILFCAKLQPWKRPLDLLRAFAKANLENGLLVYAGEGPLRRQLEAEASSLGIAEKVKFLGFVNQSQLPAIYTAADLMVLPSEYEAFAVVVNEASCCGCAVAASDHVGAARDLIFPIHPDLIYPCGDIEALTRLLQKAVANRSELAERGQAARRHMETWSPQKNISATFEAIQLGAARVGRTVVIDSSSPSLSSSATPSSGIAKERPSR